MTDTRDPAAPMADPTPRRPRSNGWAGVLYLFSALVLVGLFFLVSLGMSLWISFHTWPLIGTPSWAGFDNHTRL